MHRAALFFITVLFFFIAPAVVLAQEATTFEGPTISVSVGDLSRFEPISCQAGQVCPIDWLAVYINAIYRYGVTIAAILAVVVIMVGGFLWLTSAGNPSRVGSAKEYITSALVGLLIVLFSFIILQTVNPELVELKPLNLLFTESKVVDSQPNPSFATVDGNMGSPLLPDGLGACADPNGYNYEILLQADDPNFPLAPSITCGRYNFDGYGVDPNILQAIAATESSCNHLAVNYSSNACGMMQMLLETASAIAKYLKLTDTDISCQDLQTDVSLSIRLAAEYIKLSQISHDRYIPHIFAGYNGGYGSEPRADGKLPPLGESKDCPGCKAYECKINPGGLVETQNYVIRAVRYYRFLADN